MDTVSEITSAIREEVQLKSRILARNEPDFTSVINYLAQEAKDMQRDINAAQAEIKRMFNRNEFYMKDIVQECIAACDYLM